MHRLLLREHLWQFLDRREYTFSYCLINREFAEVFYERRLYMPFTVSFFCSTPTLFDFAVQRDVSIRSHIQYIAKHATEQMLEHVISRYGRDYRILDSAAERGFIALSCRHRNIGFVHAKGVCIYGTKDQIAQLPRLHVRLSGTDLEAIVSGPRPENIIQVYHQFNVKLHDGIMLFIARHGSLELMEWACGLRVLSNDHRLAHEAAGSGNYRMAEWYIQKYSRKIKRETIQFALAGKATTQMIDWMLEGSKITDSFAYGLFKHGKLDEIMYLCDKYPAAREISCFRALFVPDRAVITRRFIKTHRPLHQLVLDDDLDTLMQCQIYGRQTFDVLCSAIALRRYRICEWLLPKFMRIDLYRTALQSGCDARILDLLYAYGMKFTEQHIDEAIRYNNMDVIEWFYTVDPAYVIPFRLSMVATAESRGKQHVIYWALRHGLLRDCHESPLRCG